MRVETDGINLGKMLVRRKVREWNKEKVAKGMIDTGPSAPGSSPIQPG